MASSADQSHRLQHKSQLNWNRFRNSKSNNNSFADRFDWIRYPKRYPFHIRRQIMRGDQRWITIAFPSIQLVQFIKVGIWNWTKRFELFDRQRKRERDKSVVRADRKRKWKRRAMEMENKCGKMEFSVTPDIYWLIYETAFISRQNERDGANETKTMTSNTVQICSIKRTSYE